MVLCAMWPVYSSRMDLSLEINGVSELGVCVCVCLCIVLSNDVYVCGREEGGYTETIEMLFNSLVLHHLEGVLSKVN